MNTYIGKTFQEAVITGSLLNFLYKKMLFYQINSQAIFAGQ